MSLAVGFGKIGLALLFWAVVFYAPYAWSVFTWNYDNGQQPPFIYAFAFSMVVVIGNAIVYNVCAVVADRVGFCFKDERESCYMILYTVACTLNILLDLVTTYFIASYVMDGLRFRTYHGKRLHDIPTFTEHFETYAIQRFLAESAFAYAFPSTYLIPFLLEPIMTIYLPFALGRLYVRTHKEVQ